MSNDKQRYLDVEVALLFTHDTARFWKRQCRGRSSHYNAFISPASRWPHRGGQVLQSATAKAVLAGLQDLTQHGVVGGVVKSACLNALFP